jgi:ATP-dependent Lhr-like helicase
MNMLEAAQIKAQLRHTWPVFFARYGNFTPVQQQAIPPILAGQNTLIVAATAAGKTEAAVAPLLERYLIETSTLSRQPAALHLLYICPTRALVRDLYERLAPPLQTLGVTLMMKSGDTSPVPVAQPPSMLITTPESTDSLLARAPRLFTTLRALILDEIHLFDGSMRGDHLRCLLRRIEHIQEYHHRQTQQPAAPFQRVALSATVPDPLGVAARYLTRGNNQTPAITVPEASSQVKKPAGEDVAIVTVAGSRRLLSQIHPMVSLDDLSVALTLHMAHSETLHKALIFCNTRQEVEQTAAYLRQHLSFAAAVFVHYSDLDFVLRQEVEREFAAASVALCVCTSTLELGIDIGSIDAVFLIGPPPTLAAFLQRIGRGGRWRAATPVVCLSRSPLEALRFHALLDLAQGAGEPLLAPGLSTPTYHFRPSVLVQQIFSLLKQSPTGALRLADLRRLAPPEWSDEDLRRLLRQLTRLDYVQAGRPGEWRPAPALDELLDEHEIYSNIGAEPLAGVIVDAYSGRTIAQSARIRIQGETLLIGGRTWKVVWRDRYRIGVRPIPQAPVDEGLRVQAAPFAVPLDVSQAAAAHLGMASGQLCRLETAGQSWLFHFWGDLYGELLAALLQEYWRNLDELALVTAHNEFCLRLPAPLNQLPTWDAANAQRQMRKLLPRLEPFLEMGRFHSLLPADLAECAVLAQCDLPRFTRLYQAATPVTPLAGLRSRLLELTGET